jgi:hypothetical protein
MYPAHLGPGYRVDYVEPSADGPILGYTRQGIANRLKQRQSNEHSNHERNNLYAYVRNNPVNRVDPSGLASIVPGFCDGYFGIAQHCLAAGPALFQACIPITLLACEWLRCIDPVWKATQAREAEQRLKQVPLCRNVRDQDSCYHCWATCTLIRDCKIPTLPVWTAGGFLEAIGVFIDLEDSLYDLLADAAGAGCATAQRVKCDCCCVGATKNFPVT